jgi:antitoxin HicB
MNGRANRNLDAYQFTVRRLSKDEGGGYLVEYPDIPGCMSGGWRQRLPRTLYLKLTKAAENEGVSTNSLVTAIIAESMGARRAAAK